jgi:basic amino acid/polyamine antiporter, APA family
MLSMSKQTTQQERSSRGLVRDLGLAHAASIVIGVVIGSGIFLVPAEMMRAAGSAKLVYLAWIVGGLFSFCGAVTYAELGAMKPQAGGEYVYIRDAFGPLAGFLTGWTWTIVVKPASLSAVSTGIVQVLGSFSRLSFLVTDGNHLTLSGELVAFVVILFISALNYIGVRRAGNFQLAFTVLKIVLVLVISAMAFSSSGTWQHFQGRYIAATGGIVGFILAVKAALWAYDGWSDLNMVAEEVSAPERNIPLALVGGLIAIAALYMLVNAAVQYTLPVDALARTSSPMSDAVRVGFGNAGAALMAGAIIISLLTSLNGIAMSGARMAFAMSRDGNFFSSLASVHSRFHTPHVAIAVQGLLSVAFLFVGGNFEQLFTLSLYAEWLSYVAASVSLFVFRSQEPVTHPVPFWRYPLAPALFILASAPLLYYTFTSNLKNSALGSLVILVGVPVYFAFALRRRAV